MKVVLTKSVVVSRPLLDPDTKKPLRTKVKHNSVEMTIDAAESELLAGDNATVRDLPNDIAKELLANGLARLPDAAIDGGADADEV